MNRRLVRYSAIIIALALAGCGSKDSKDKDDTKSSNDKGGDTKKGDDSKKADTTPPKTDGDTKPPAQPKPVETDKPPEPPAPAAVTLVDVSQGDMGCYLEVEDAKGASVTHLGGFDLCPEGEADASAHMGEKVVLTLSKEEIPAGTCEGDPDCTDTEEVEVVTKVALAK
jgi:type IV secretory pathway VirB10-like protein